MSATETTTAAAGVAGCPADRSIARPDRRDRGDHAGGPGIPEVMGYTSIAGMPVVTGLYTILVPTAVFALLGSSRHLVVGADSATAAILAAGIGGLAPIASPTTSRSRHGVAVRGRAYLILARIVRLGFIADFLSRTVLIGFLTGVGIQVAIGQVPDMLGLPKEATAALRHAVARSRRPRRRQHDHARRLRRVIAVIVGETSGTEPPCGTDRRGRLDRWRAPSGTSPTMASRRSGPFRAVCRPSVGPACRVGPRSVASVAFSIFVVILAQSAATSRAYAAQYSDQFDENVDLVGLGMANVAAGLTGTFVVNGSPTKTQMVDGSGGRCQIAQLTMSGSCCSSCCSSRCRCSTCPTAVLAAVVFVIGIELVDIAGMRRIFRFRHDEFLVAAITAGVVVFVGVLQGIVLAIVLSLVDHLRRSYHPRDTLLVKEDSGRWRTVPVPAPEEASPATDAEPGLVIYWFGATLYYANANRFTEESAASSTGPPAPRHGCASTAPRSATSTTRAARPSSTCSTR